MEGRKVAREARGGYWQGHSPVGRPGEHHCCSRERGIPMAHGRQANEAALGVAGRPGGFDVAIAVLPIRLAHPMVQDSIQTGNSRPSDQEECQEQQP